MTIIDFFNPHDLEHLKAYRVLEKTGMWPVEFVPSNVADQEWPLIWHALLAAKMTAAWLNAVENGKVRGVAGFVPEMKEKNSHEYVLKAFNADGDEVPYAVEDGDFTCQVPKGYTLKKYTLKKGK
jgi:hypothetical protein